MTRGKEGLMMKLDERYVPDPACLLQAISETDGRLVLSVRGAARMVLKLTNMTDAEVLIEALKVIRKLVKRVEELEAEKKAQEESKE